MVVTAPSPGGSWFVTDAQNVLQMPSVMVCVLPFSGGQCHCITMSQAWCGGILISAWLALFPRICFSLRFRVRVRHKENVCRTGRWRWSSPWCPGGRMGTRRHCHLPTVAARMQLWAAPGPKVAPAPTGSPSRTSPGWAKGAYSFRPAGASSHLTEAVRHRLGIQLVPTSSS